MLVVLQIVTVLGMIFATFFVYQALGPRRPTLTYSKKEKAAWDAIAGNDFGSWLTVCSTLASITSLATVYVFFIGNTRLFGWWILFPIVTIWGGSFITNHFTAKLTMRPHIAARLKSADQSLAALPALMLDGTRKGITAASIVRGVTLANIAAILWMEFSVFADISSYLIAPGQIWVGAVFIFLCSFSVIFFTLTYGLRGFVFADLFQTPLIVLGTVVLVIGATIFLLNTLSSNGGSNVGTLVTLINREMSAPKISAFGGAIFAVSCIFLNSFLVLVTQPHWLRVWMFGHKETRLQVLSLSATCIVWVTLIILGALASVAISLDEDMAGTIGGGDDVVIFFLDKMSATSPLYAVAFWIAGMAALFSTSDGQIYSFLMVERFNPSLGRITNAAFDRLRPLLHSLVAAAIFAAGYVAVRWLGLPFENLVLLLLPTCLNIVPALILAARGAPQVPALLWTSIGFYWLCATLGLMDTALSQLFAVGAPLVPILASLVALLIKSPEIRYAASKQRRA